jgi:hypothetical protein
LSASGQHPWQQPEFIERNRERTRERLLDLSASSQNPFQQPELIERNRERLLDLSARGQNPFQQPELIERNREQLLDLSASGQHPLQQPELIERNRQRLLDLSARGQNPFQQQDFIERNRENRIERANELVAQGKQCFVTENPAKKRLKKLFEDSKSTHYIDICDKTGEYQRQWPNKAWPPRKNWIIFEEGVAKKKKSFSVADLKEMGVTPATQLRGIGCTYTSLVLTKN